MDSNRLKREIGLYGLAFGLALALRLIRLGNFPLTEAEAVPALQAIQVALGARTGIGPQSVYVLLTGMLFFAFESSNFLARLAPALTGSLLVFAPMLFKHRIKPRTSLVLAFFLALDPGLLALSRQAGSGIFAVTFLLFTWGFWERKSVRLAGFFAALALLSGPALWPGLLGLGLTWLILKGLEQRSPTGAATVPVSLSSFWQTLLPTLILFGTFFFVVPSGLSGIFTGLVDYLRGWTVPSGVSGVHVYSSLFFYQPLTLLFALVGIFRGIQVGSRRVIRLGVWMVVALLLAAFYPGRQVYDLAWMLLPFSALAALEISRHMDLRPNERAEVFGVTALSVVILIFAWSNLSSLVWSPTPGGQINLRVWLFFGSIFLLVVSLLLIAVGWSIRTARLGAVWAVVIALGVLMLGAGMGAGRIRADVTSEFWNESAYPTHADLLAATVDQLSEWETGSATSLPVTISGVDSPALLWVLRRHEVIIVDSLDASTAPPILITPLRGDPNLAAPYRGQDFTWSQKPDWNGGLFDNWLKWAVLRTMPQSFDTLLLWARDDLFLDSASQSAP
jgi:hypothetical protein